MTNEQPQVHRTLHHLGIGVHTQALLTSFDGSRVELQNIFTRAASELELDSVVIVGSRSPNHQLFDEIKIEAPKLLTELIGDAYAPGALVHAVYSGHQYARNLDTSEKSYLRDMPITENPPTYTI